jgi:hypothetical protein
MSEAERAAWLEDFAALLERNPFVRIYYTNSDDGVWVGFADEKKLRDVGLGFIEYERDERVAHVRRCAESRRKAPSPPITGET